MIEIPFAQALKVIDTKAFKQKEMIVQVLLERHHLGFVKIYDKLCEANKNELIYKGYTVEEAHEGVWGPAFTIKW